MKKLTPILLLVLVFVAGVVSGVVGTRVVVRKMMQNAVQNPTAVRERIERELAAELDLTPEQRSQFSEKLKHAHEELQKVRAEFQPRIMETIRGAEADIATILTPEQKAKFEKLAREKRVFFRMPPPMGKPPFPRGERPEGVRERRPPQ